jgi:hypothetical protein
VLYEDRQMSATTLTRPSLKAGSPALSRASHRIRYWLPLAVILVAQAALTIRLFGMATTDEGRYLQAGHALIYEFWHGGGSPYYETYFSGAPDLYPPLAAMAQFVGGFAAVRLMSTFFMLAATTAMFGTSRRLFGYWPAVTASALYAGLFVTQAVGRNIIYDAMAISILSIAAYCASHADQQSGAGWLLSVVPLLVLADFTKYVSVIFNPAVIAICAYQIRHRGWKAMLQRVLVLAVSAALAFVLVAFIAGTAYWKGMLWTTFGRHVGQNAVLASVFEPPRTIISETMSWEGAVALAAAAAILVAAFTVKGRERWPLVALLFVLGMTAVVVAVEGIHLHSNESMGRHTAYAAWYGCVAAGYLITALVTRFSHAYWRAPMAGICAVGIVLSGYHYSFQNHDFEDLGGVGIHSKAVPAYFAGLRPYLTDDARRYLIDGDTGYDIVSLDGLSIPWWDLTDDNYIKYPIPGRGGNWHWTTSGATCTSLRPSCQYLTGAAGYAAAIKAHAFALILLHRHSLSTDAVIEHAVETTPGYVLLTDVGGGPTWIYLPDYQH